MIGPLVEVHEIVRVFLAPFSSYPEVQAMLDDDKTYEKLNKDPTGKYKRKLVKEIARLKKEKKITQSQYDDLFPTAENVPRINATPKIHKDNVPLIRPIVDYTGSIGYRTSRALISRHTRAARGTK